MNKERHRPCRLCGHKCLADRTAGQVGRCGAGQTIGLAQTLLHHGEEPPISGRPPGGSGTIFFTSCNLACAFCQNWQISQTPKVGVQIEPQDLAKIMLQLEDSGAYNINLVSPTPYVAQIAKALELAKNQGLTVPIVYNTGGYDSLRALAIMEGLVDIYLPDVKIAQDPNLNLGDPDPVAMRLFGAGDYPYVNQLALKEMLRQTGHLVINKSGLATKGLLPRHLVLPDNLARTDLVLQWIAENLGQGVYLSLMAQYHPNHLLKHGDPQEFRSFPGLTRPLSVREYEIAMNLAWELKLENAFVQDLESAVRLVPDFQKPEVFDN